MKLGNSESHETLETLKTYETIILNYSMCFRFMGMIIHTAEDEFVAHVFHCEPSAGGLCKIIEAACKVS